MEEAPAGALGVAGVRASVQGDASGQERAVLCGVSRLLSLLKVLGVLVTHGTCLLISASSLCWKCWPAGYGSDHFYPEYV